MKLPCCTFKIITNGALSALFLFLGVYSLVLRFWALAAIFLVLGLIYLAITLIYAPTVTVSEAGVTKALFGKTLRSLSWEQVRQVSVIGTRVAAKPSKRGGTPFFLFLDRTMSEDDLFAVALKWPPKDIIFLYYDEKSYALVQKYYHDTITTGNFGKAELGVFGN